MNFKKFFKQPTQTPITEAPQSPSDLEEFFKSPMAQQMRFGFEAEVIATGFYYDGDSELEREELYINGDDIDDISNFFGRYQRRGLDGLRGDYADWLYEKQEELIDEYISDNLEERAAELKKKDEDNEEELRDDDEYEEEARDELRDEAPDNIDDSDLTFSDFCQSEGYITYADLADNYGFDWPDDRYIGGDSVVDSDTGYSLDRAQEIADMLESAMDIEVRAFSDYHGGKYASEGTWRIEPDGSLTPDDKEIEAGMEIITPNNGLPLKEGIAKMMELFKLLKSKRRAYTSESATTGLHINLSIPEQYEKEIDYAKLVLFSGDEYVLEQFDRVGGYNDEAVGQITNAITAGNVEEALRLMRKGMTTAASVSLIRSNKSRTVTVNKKPGYVEFRVVGNDYLSMADEVRMAVLRFARALTIAADPEAYKEEYAKKLYKLIHRTITTAWNGATPDAIELFASSLAQLSYGPPTREAAIQLQQLKAKLTSTRMQRQTKVPNLPDRKHKRDPEADFKAEALLNAKALGLLLKYRNDTYGFEEKNLQVYYETLKTAKLKNIAGAFDIYYRGTKLVGAGDKNFERNALLAFTPLAVLEQYEHGVIVGTQTGAPFFVMLNPQSKRIFLNNVIQNYS